MEKGEKYLTIMILNSLKVVAFPNEKTKENQPDFKGDGVSVWINEKKGEIKTIKPKEL